MWGAAIRRTPPFANRRTPLATYEMHVYEVHACEDACL